MLHKNTRGDPPPELKAAKRNVMYVVGGTIESLPPNNECKKRVERVHAPPSGLQGMLTSCSQLWKTITPY